MTDTPTPPEGWYPDPAGSGGLRRWNGTAWTDEVRARVDAPEAAAAPEAPAVPDASTVPDASSGPEAPAAPTAPAAPAVPEASAAPEAPASFGAEPSLGASAAPAAPASPGAPVYPGTPAPAAPYPGDTTSPGAAAYPGGTAYPTAPAAPTAAPVRRDIPTDTVWIWLVVALPLLSLAVLFLFDWNTYVQESLYASAFPEAAPYAASSSLAVTAGASIGSFVLAGLIVLFSYLDWRQLRARGIQNPFHWAFGFFVLLLSSGAVYIIGRAVVLRRQTGKGLGPVWGWIAVTIITIVAVSIWVVMLFTAMIPVIEELQSYGY